jgi:acetyltransferase-like isoleucine patch superfamily enzyme
MFNKILLIHLYPYYIKRILDKYFLHHYIIKLGVNIGARSKIMGMPIVSIFQGSKITIGDDCILCSRTEMNPLGINHSIILTTLRAGAVINIGNHTGMSGGAICAAMSVDIGSECLLGANVIITDTDFHPVSPNGRYYCKDPDKIATAPVIIEDNVFVGTGAIILKGVRIGKNSVIGAGAVVSKNVPANSIAVGNPAKVIRQF